MFFSNTRWAQLLVPQEILISKISLKYIPIHIYSLGVRKPLINCQTAPTSQHVVWEGFMKNYPSSYKN